MNPVISNSPGFKLFTLNQVIDEVNWSLYHLYSLKTKSSWCHYVVTTRSGTKLLVAIPAPTSGQSAVNVATSKCSITFLLPYDQDGDVKTKQDNVSNILKPI